MDLEAFCRQSRVVLVLGKGGVGKTTVAAALGLAAAKAGLRALLIGLDDAGTIPSLFGQSGPLVYSEQRLCTTERGGALYSRGITSDEALLEYLERHGLARVARRLVASGVLEVVATAIPGIREVLVLGKVRQLADEDPADLLVLDAPASGHAMTFLTSATGLLHVTRTGPLRDQATRVEALLKEPVRSRVLLVTLAEETPVNETIETAFRLEDEVGVTLGAVVANGILPDHGHLDAALDTLSEVGLDADLAQRLVRAADLRLARERLQREQLARLNAELPLPRIDLPFCFSASLGRGELDALADALCAGIGAL